MRRLCMSVHVNFSEKLLRTKMALKHLSQVYSSVNIATATTEESLITEFAFIFPFTITVVNFYMIGQNTFIVCFQPTYMTN